MAISGIGAASSMSSSMYSMPSAGLGAASQSTESASQQAVDNFNAWANMTPAQQMRASILKSMGLTEDDLKAMTPQQRQAVEDTIRERIKDAALRGAEQGKTGLVTDVKA